MYETKTLDDPLLRYDLKSEELFEIYRHDLPQKGEKEQNVRQVLSSHHIKYLKTDHER